MSKQREDNEADDMLRHVRRSFGADAVVTGITIGAVVTLRISSQYGPFVAEIPRWPAVTRWWKTETPGRRHEWRGCLRADQLWAFVNAWRDRP